MRRYAIAAAAAAVLAMPLGAQVTVTTGAPNSNVQPVGKESDNPVVATALAQTFLLPGGTNYLQTFTLFVSAAFGGGSSVQLAASVYAFDAVDGNLIGSPLYFSGLFPGSDNTGGYDQVSFGSGTPLNIHLAPGTVYALLLSAVEGYASTPDFSTVAVGTTDDLYADGSAFVTLNTDQPSALRSWRVLRHWNRRCIQRHVHVQRPARSRPAPRSSPRVSSASAFSFNAVGERIAALARLASRN